MKAKLPEVRPSMFPLVLGVGVFFVIILWAWLGITNALDYPKPEPPINQRFAPEVEIISRDGFQCVRVKDGDSTTTWQCFEVGGASR